MLLIFIDSSIFHYINRVYYFSLSVCIYFDISYANIYKTPTLLSGCESQLILKYHYWILKINLLLFSASNGISLNKYYYKHFGTQRNVWISERWIFHEHRQILLTGLNLCEWLTWKVFNCVNPMLTIIYINAVFTLNLN